jgi:hypothetical protein
LAVNFFDYWATRGLDSIGRALGCGTAAAIDYEVQYTKPQLVRGFPPNVDVELSPPKLGIEVKFAEPYDSPKLVTLSSAYDNLALWSALGLPRCGALASSIVRGPPKFGRLDSAQLLKHIVGMTNQLGKGNYALVYLWYREGGQEAIQLKAELASFIQALAGEIDFRAFTFQEVYASVAGLRQQHVAYFDYLDARYF